MKFSDKKLRERMLPIVRCRY